MSFWILLLILCPLTSGAIVLFFSHHSENFVSRLATRTKILLGAATVGALATWFSQGMRPTEIDIGLPAPFVFYFDGITAVFLALIAGISAIIIRYCRYYLHAEEGYARFFMTIFLFLSGMELLVTAGTLDLLFAGWEIVGISSFLLIAFYRERILPVRNALRAYYVYRLCDLGLLAAVAWSHLRWTAFPPEPSLALGLLLLFAATGKSAQFPFCFWLPRAMEGPTPSSAIFYGALSIHAGIYLLLRAFPVWWHLPAARYAVGAIGGLSVVVATLSGKTQSNIKGQLAYASVTQVGFILIELALGWTNLALLHAAANAFLRCYQLLVSPSVVAQYLRGQRSAARKRGAILRLFPSRIQSTLYVFALNEGYLEAAFRRFLLLPLSGAGHAVHRLFSDRVAAFAALATAAAIGFSLLKLLSPQALLALVAALTVVLATLFAWAERSSRSKAWNAIGISAAAAGLSTLILEPRALPEAALYFAGILPAWVAGRLILPKVRTRPLTFFLCALALAAFPISPAFFGEDLILDHGARHSAGVAAALCFSFVLNGLTLIRLYSRVGLPSTTALKKVSELALPPEML